MYNVYFVTIMATLLKGVMTTATQLCVLLKSRGYSIDLRTVLRCRSQLGWAFRGSAYCQLIREANKVKRVDWCTANGDNDFSDLIFTDECSIQLESNVLQKEGGGGGGGGGGQPPKPKPRCVYIFQYTKIKK